IRTAPDVSAPAGKAGTWLIDPTTVTIVAESEDVVAGDGSEANPFAPNSINETISYDLILDAMDGGATVRIVTECTDEAGCADDAEGNIVFQDFSFDSATSEIEPYGGTLILHAANNIEINTDIYDYNDGYGGLA